MESRDAKLLRGCRRSLDVVENKKSPSLLQADGKPSQWRNSERDAKPLQCFIINDVVMHISSQQI